MTTPRTEPVELTASRRAVIEVSLCNTSKYDLIRELLSGEAWARQEVERRDAALDRFEAIVRDGAASFAALEVANAQLRECVPHFYCPECHQSHVKADEDGCCHDCGADCEVRDPVWVTELYAERAALEAGLAEARAVLQSLRNWLGDDETTDIATLVKALRIYDATVAAREGKSNE